MVNHYSWLFPYSQEAYMSKEIEMRNQNIEYPNLILCLTQITAYLCAKSARREIGVIPNPNSYSKQAAIPWKDRENIILTIARYDEPAKRLDKILEIFSQIYKENKNIRLMVVGKVSYKETFGIDLEEELKKLALPKESIIFTGIQKNVEKFYRKAKVFLFASEMEGFGLVINEAQSFGIPVISNYYLGIEDMISYGENGYYENIFDEKGKENAVAHSVRLFADEKRWTEMSTKAYEMVDRFSEEEVIKKWGNIIDIIIEDSVNKEQLLREINVLPKYQPSIQETETIFSQYESLIKGMIARINRADQGQNILNAMYLNEKEKNITNVSLKILTKEIIRRIKSRV